jgi:hypothetical protein
MHISGLGCAAAACGYIPAWDTICQRAMYESHTRLGIKPQRGHGRYDANSAVIWWCIADPDLAAAFAKEFGAIS